MKKISLFIFLIAFFCSALVAQRRNGLIGHRTENSGSLFASLGPSYTFADPDCSRGFFGPIFNQNLLMNEGISLGYLKVFQSTYAYRLTLGYDHFTGADIGSLQQQRGYSFSTNAFQFNGVFLYQYHFGPRFSRNKPHSVYAFLGLGMIGSTADLNVGTNKRGNYTYKSISEPPAFVIAPLIPYGFGYNYDLDRTFTLGAEFLWKYTFTDFLDGFKPPFPESKSNDVIQGFAVTLSYKIQ